MVLIHSGLCNHFTKAAESVSYSEREREQGRGDNTKFSGISSACAKFQSKEALALFVEKQRKEAISQESVMKASELRQELQSTQIQRQG